MHLLFETASGYSLFEANDTEDIGKHLDQVQADAQDLSKVGKRLILKSFLPFKNAAHALDNMNSISEGILHPTLVSFLEMNLPKSAKKSTSKSSSLGVLDKALASCIKQELGIECVSNDLVNELGRCLRLHGDKMLRQLSPGDLEKAQLGLGHSYSRGKVRFNVNRSDNMIIQAIALCDQLDKDINLFSMRIREWYSWHFPELAKIISDHGAYARLAILVRNKSSLTESSLDGINEIVQDSNKSQQIIDAARTSMGTDISDIDMINIDHFGHKLIDLTEYRKKLGCYLSGKMNIVAPNLAALIGDSVGARLISHAGSLTNLAKFPASTVQILGAEKALFRALKTKGKTPKYGLIFHSSFIGKAAMKNKGRISRYLANKCSIASRIDSFSENPNPAFGHAMRVQIEDRLNFFETGEAPLSNETVMKGVVGKIKSAESISPEGGKKRKLAESPAIEEKEVKKAKEEERKESVVKTEVMIAKNDLKTIKEERKKIREEKKKDNKEIKKEKKAKKRVRVMVKKAVKASKKATKGQKGKPSNKKSK